MPEDPITPEAPPPFPEYDVPNIGTVTAHEGAYYHVRTPDGRVVAYRSPGGAPSELLAQADIAHAIANPEALPPPPVLSRLRFVMALRKVVGLNEGGVFALISQLPADQQEDARDMFEYASEFRRDHPMIVALGALNGNTPEQIDQVFRVGASLPID
jgi:hypothetical protein